MKSLSQEYIMGIKDGRERLNKYGIAIAAEELANLNRTIKDFAATTPVG